MDDVDDLAQEAVVVADRSLQKCDPTRDFGHWLRGVARHLLHQHFRTTARGDDAMNQFRLTVSRLLDDGLEGFFQHQSAAHVESQLRCVEKLPERMTAVIRLGLKGLRSNLIAEQLSTTVSGVCDLPYRAKQLRRPLFTSTIRWCQADMT